MQGKQEAYPWNRGKATIYLARILLLAEAALI